MSQIPSKATHQQLVVENNLYISQLSQFNLPVERSQSMRLNPEEYNCGKSNSGMTALKAYSLLQHDKTYPVQHGFNTY